MWSCVLPKLLSWAALLPTPVPPGPPGGSAEGFPQLSHQYRGRFGDNRATLALPEAHGLLGEASVPLDDAGHQGAEKAAPISRKEGLAGSEALAAGNSLRNTSSVIRQETCALDLPEIQTWYQELDF